MNKTIEKLSNGDFKVSEMDECIVCGVETNEPKDKHIDFRVNFIEGSGQLCGKCIEKYEE
jgi:hypothetical protein